MYKSLLPYRPTIKEFGEWHKAIWFSLFTDFEKAFERWDLAANVIFGAMLSAYFGYKISFIEENIYNSFLIAMIIICHVFFLFSIIFSRKVEGIITLVSLEERNYDIANMYRITIPAILIFLAGVFWRCLFKSFYFYISIMLTWLLMSTLYALLVNHIISQAIKSKRVNDGAFEKESKIDRILEIIAEKNEL